MPLYEYECDACGHTFEQIRKFSDPPIEKCPRCGAPVRKLISSPAIQFKGSGWYVTDYAKKDQTPARTERNEKNEKTEKGEKGEKGETKQESTAPKSETSDSKKESTSAKPEKSETTKS